MAWFNEFVFGQGRHPESKDDKMVTLKDGMVEFRFFRPQAQRAYIAGDFNNWRSGEIAMARNSDGHWVARMKLPAGEFRFRYCADGEWFTDYAAFGVEPGRFGLDSVVRVAQPTLRMTPASIEEDERAVAVA
jgi:1,4-alpha-glucan branching enzyme